MNRGDRREPIFKDDPDRERFLLSVGGDLHDSIDRRCPAWYPTCGMMSTSSDSRGTLPFMRSMEEAMTMCEKEQDNFYVTAFMIEAWLGQILLEAAAEYAEKKNARERHMQHSQAWRAFRQIFGHAKPEEIGHIFTSLLRFGEYDGSMPEMLFEALKPLQYEHEYCGDFVGPKTLGVAERPAEALALLRDTLERWCGWLDALVHWRTHEMFHLSPVL